VPIASSEQLVQAGLVVMRGRLDTGLARDFGQEWMGVFPNTSAVADAEKEGEPVARLGAPVRDIYFGRTTYGTLPVTNRLLVELGAAMPTTGVMRMTVNLQPPSALQGWHDDSRKVAGVIQVVHTDGEGAFDFSLTARTKEEAAAEEADGTTLSIEGFRPGDVLLQPPDRMFHRGRNMGTTARITTAIALSSGR
jgi:hypothetical protein